MFRFASFPVKAVEGDRGRAALPSGTRTRARHVILNDPVAHFLKGVKKNPAEMNV